MSTLQPLADHVVAEPMPVNERTTAGIYLPANAKEKPQMAKVLAVGKDVKEIAKNDVIVYKDFSSTEVKIDSKEYLVLKAEDVLAIVK